VGGDLPVALVSARTARFIDRVLGDRRLEMAGHDRQLDEELLALHELGRQWIARGASGNGNGGYRDVAPPEPSKDDLLDCAEVARRLNLGPRQVRNLARDLDARKRGGRWLFDAALVDEYATLRGG
jgi:hypothetical protein